MHQTHDCCRGEPPIHHVLLRFQIRHDSLKKTTIVVDGYQNNIRLIVFPLKHMVFFYAGHAPFSVVLPV